MSKRLKFWVVFSFLFVAVLFAWLEAQERLPIYYTRTWLCTPDNLKAQLSVARAGDTMLFQAGTYTNNNILKKGVNYYGYPGAILSYTVGNASSNTLAGGYGIFDDRGIGATTNIIEGYLVVQALNHTNVQFDDDCIATVGNSNFLGAVVITNALSRPLFHFAKVGAASILGGLGEPNAVYVRNCLPGSKISVDYYFNPAPGDSFTRTNCPNDPGSVYTFNFLSSGISWWLGSCTFEWDRMETNINLYGIGIYGVTTSDIADGWFRGNFCGAKVYSIGTSYNQRTWLEVLEFLNANSVNTGALEFHGQGKYYVTSQKIESSDPNSIVINVTAGGPTNLDVYITAQKVSGPKQWMNVDSGYVRANVQHFVDIAGSVTAGIVVKTNVTLELDTDDANASGTVLRAEQGATVIARGGILNTTNTSPAVVVQTNAYADLTFSQINSSGNALQMQGGSAVIRGGTLKSTNMAPVFLCSGNEVLNLKMVTLLTTTSSTNCVSATNSLPAAASLHLTGIGNTTNYVFANSIATTNIGWSVDLNVTR